MSARPTPLPELHVLDLAPVAEAVGRRLGVAHRVVREVVLLHLQTVVAAAEWNVPEVLAEQLRWERTRLDGAGITLRPGELQEAVLHELSHVLGSVAHARLRVLYAAATATAADPAATPPPPLSPAAERYLDAALVNDVPAAVREVRTALARGADAPTVIREILQPAQVETGRRWESGVLGVAEEHRVTAITARCLALFEVPRTATGVTAPRPRLLASTVGEEIHDLGLRMLSEVMTDGGWDVEYLGAGVPAQDLVEHAASTRPDVLALSATMTAHVPLVAAVVGGVRRSDNPGLRVLVGGRAFASQPDLAAALGADAWAGDADTALLQCRTWMGLPAAPVDALVADPATGPDARLDGLAERYRIDRHHVSGALDLLAAHSGLSRDELAARLGTQAS